MPRYFLEVSYLGTNYSGFQVQENAHTIQSEVTNAFQTIQRQTVELTGSSRTDAGVHALQNYFHFDFEGPLHPQLAYKLNALLSPDIAVKRIFPMPDQAHSRFDAVSREYEYRIHRYKDPFLQGRSLYYPYRLDKELLKQAADEIKLQTNFYAFAKTNSQVKNFICTVEESNWSFTEAGCIYTIRANRFLRGMVRLITATLLRVGRGTIEMNELLELFNGTQKCGHSVPAHGLYLKEVRYPQNYFPASDGDFTAF